MALDDGIDAGPLAGTAMEGVDKSAAPSINDVTNTIFFTGASVVNPRGNNV
jgi:hypothetical protein